MKILEFESQFYQSNQCPSRKRIFYTIRMDMRFHLCLCASHIARQVIKIEQYARPTTSFILYIYYFTPQFNAQCKIIYNVFQNQLNCVRTKMYEKNSDESMQIGFLSYLSINP